MFSHRLNQTSLSTSEATFQQVILTRYSLLESNPINPTGKLQKLQFLQRDLKDFLQFLQRDLKDFKIEIPQSIGIVKVESTGEKGGFSPLIYYVCTSHDPP